MRFIPTCATLTLGAFLAAAPAGAQGMALGSMGLGIKGGLNIAGMDVEGTDEEERRMGLALGAQAEFGVTSPFSLVIEPGYLQRGATFDATFPVIGEVESDVRLAYFEIPILAKAKFGSIRTAHAYAFLGPSLGFLMSAEAEIGDNESDVEDETAGFALSADIGFGGAYRLAEFTYLSADARYSHGLLDLADSDDEDAGEWMSRDIRLSLGVLWHLIQ